MNFVTRITSSILFYEKSKAIAKGWKSLSEKEWEIYSSPDYDKTFERLFKECYDQLDISKVGKGNCKSET
jgi:hypothetical protein